MKAAILVAGAIAAGLAGEAPASRVKLPEGATLFVRVHTVDVVTTHMEFVNGETRTNARESVRDIDWCVKVRRAGGAFLMDWREVERGSSTCPRERGFLVRANASLEPISIVNWRQKRREMAGSPDITPVVQRFLLEMTEDQALEAFFLPATLVSRGQGQDFSDGPEIVRSALVEMQPSPPANIVQTTRLEGVIGDQAAVVWTQTGRTSKLWSFKAGKPPIDGDPTSYVSRDDVCRFAVDRTTSLVRSGRCDLNRQMVLVGKPKTEYARTIEVTQSLVQ